MPNLNPFPVGTFQSVFDSFLTAMQSIRTPAVLGKVLPFIVVVWVVGVVVFGFLWLWFRAFSLISDRTFSKIDETIDWFVGKRLSEKEKKKVEFNQKYWWKPLFDMKRIWL